MSIRLLLIDDHALLRQALISRFESEPDIEVVSQAENATEGVLQAIKVEPDIILMDIDMPGISCFDAAKQIHAKCKNTSIIFLSGFFSDVYIQQALGVEALGFVTKSSTPETVLEAVYAVAAGELFFSPEIMSRIVIGEAGVSLKELGNSRLSLLTDRELEILRYIAQGNAKKEIGALMHLSVKTVDNHTQNLMKKLDINDRVNLTRFAIREGLIEP